MKRIFPILVGAFVGAVMGVGSYRAYRIHRESSAPKSPPPSTEPFASPADNARHEAFARIAAKEKCDVLFVGDSLTDYWRDYPDLWDRYFGSMNALNFGVGADRTANLMNRIEGGEFAGLHPRLVVILIGTNDLYPGADAGFFSGQILRTARDFQVQLHCRVIIMAILPRSRPAPIADVNKTLADSGYDFFDLTTRLGDGKGGINADLTTDGTHLNSRGYAAWGETLAPVLRKMLDQ